MVACVSGFRAVLYSIDVTCKVDKKGNSLCCLLDVKEKGDGDGSICLGIPCRTRGPEGICQAQLVLQNNNALPSEQHTREVG
jgi:hypothetical protein